MRRFHLRRVEDVSGVSGIGVVAEGVEFIDGSVGLHWVSALPMTSWGIYRSIEEVIAIHGHEGRTLLEWVDTEDSAA